MPVKQQIKESIEITKRFVRAYEELRYRGFVKTKKEYCENVGIGMTSNLKRMNDSDTYEPTITQLVLLLKNYPVSVDWLMFGEGDFLASARK